MLVLKQALCSSYQKHRIEFTARNEEELSDILDGMRKTENTESFQYNILRYAGVKIRVVRTLVLKAGIKYTMEVRSHVHLTSKTSFPFLAQLGSLPLFFFFFNECEISEHENDLFQHF